MQLQTVETQRLYQLVAQQIEEMIRAGKIEPGSRLPSERELAAQLGVSRPSVREAMVALEISGLVEDLKLECNTKRAEAEPFRMGGYLGGYLHQDDPEKWKPGPYVLEVPKKFLSTFAGLDK